ncbi:histidine kinase [Kribbella sp. NPDC023855]|uniref:sensor histidine kinase n=1 Tax=Kribbella sp. NPDC023855 TaxID=3154698 RepID=UPI0033FDF5E2
MSGLRSARAVEQYDENPAPAREALVGLVGLGTALLIGYGFTLGFHLDNLHNGLLAAAFTAVGLYVLRVRPGHREARLFVATGVASAIMFFGRQYGLHDEPLPGAAWLGWIGVWPLPLVIALTGVTVMAFPDGRFLSRRWRIAALAMLVVAAALAVPSALWPVEYDRVGMVAPHPFDMPGRDIAESILTTARSVCYALFQLLFTIAVVARMLRAKGDEARQLRWFVFAVALDLLVLLGGVLVFDSPVPGLLGTPVVAIAAGAAILKYRLYDIDPVINKTLVVGVMAAVITTGYLVVVVGIGALVPFPEGVMTLVATALVACAFEPARRRVQRLADQLVYGHRATPYEALSSLSAQLLTPRGELLDGLAATVANAVGATEVVVWVGDDRVLRAVAAWPDPCDRPPTSLAQLGEERQIVRQVVHDLAIRGAVTVRKRAGEPLTEPEDRLLTDLVAQTGLVIDHQAKVQQVADQAAELQAAARRIVTAQDAARRRIERNLHDGAQQRLVTLGLELGALAGRAAESGHPDLAERAEYARQQLLNATAALRELARGLHPSVLTQDGLGPALADLADSSAIPVQLRVEVARRQPAEVEATAYFFVSEAITNACRHSGAAVVEVVARDDEQGLWIQVSDDGAGGADLAAGSGLQGLADRLGALGAQLEIESPAGAGTRVGALIPVEPTAPSREAP